MNYIAIILNRMQVKLFIQKVHAKNRTPDSYFFNDRVTAPASSSSSAHPAPAQAALRRAIHGWPKTPDRTALSNAVKGRASEPRKAEREREIARARTATSERDLGHSVAAFAMTDKKSHGTE